MEAATVNQNWKALIKPTKLNIKSNEDKSFTTVVAEPLEKGYALTIGNSLRRILLSSIQGSAITALQIDGVLHEFSSIKGVREDVTDIVLNVKSLSKFPTIFWFSQTGSRVVFRPVVGGSPHGY